jgi:hypothetical protein
MCPAPALFIPKNMASDSQLLFELFSGSDLAHGRTALTGRRNAQGKVETKSWTEKRGVTEKDWELHLAGKLGIGIPPINSESHVKWGAIDVDTYGTSFEDLVRTIYHERIPFVPVLSKSGGLHLYLFVKEWVPAKDMIERLDALAGYLGLGTSEIFPKQAIIAAGQEGKGSQDYGNWINMPYFRGTERLGLKSDNTTVLQVSDFVTLCKSRTLSPDDFTALRSPEDETELPDGPPCLNRIFQKSNLDEYRNVTLSNVAVYLKQAYGTDWESRLDDYNQKFATPLGSREVQAIKASYNRKEYRYQCSCEPLKSFCNSTECRKRKFGVGGGGVLANNRSLTKIKTDPPVWYLDIVHEGQPYRMSLSTDDLQNPRLFQKRCMEVINMMPPVAKNEDWQPLIQSLLAHVTEIEVPPEATPTGQMIEHLLEFLSSRATSESLDNVARGIPYKDLHHYYFKLSDFLRYLDTHKFRDLRQNEIVAILKDTMKATQVQRRIAARNIRCWMIGVEIVGRDPHQFEATHEPEVF